MTERLDPGHLAGEIEQAVETYDVARINDLRVKLIAHLHQNGTPMTSEQPEQRDPAGTEFAAGETAAEPRFWQLLCNGVGPGRLVGYVEAPWQAGREGVAGDLVTGLTWTSRPTQAPGPERSFELRPLTEAEALEWIRANHRVTAQ